MTFIFFSFLIFSVIISIILSLRSTLVVADCLLLVEPAIDGCGKGRISFGQLKEQLGSNHLFIVSFGSGPIG